MGHTTEGVEVLLDPDTSITDRLYTEKFGITDLATGDLDGDSVMDVVFGAVDAPPIVGTLLVK